MQRSQRLGGSQCSAEGSDPTVPATFTEVPNMPKSKPKRSMRLELRRNVKPGTTVARRRVFCHKSSMPETKTRTSTTSPRRRPWSSPFALRLFAQGVRSRSHCDCKRGPAPKKLRGGLGSHDEGFGCVLLRFSLPAVYVTAGFLTVSPEQVLPCLSGCAERIQQWASA